MDTKIRIYQRIGEFVVSLQWLENKLREISWFILDPERSIWPPTGLRELTNEELINEVHRLFLDALPKCEHPDPDASQSHFIEGISEIADTLHQLRRDKNRILHSVLIELSGYGEEPLRSNPRLMVDEETGEYLFGQEVLRADSLDKEQRKGQRQHFS